MSSAINVDQLVSAIQKLYTQPPNVRLRINRHAFTELGPNVAVSLFLPPHEPIPLTNCLPSFGQTIFSRVPGPTLDRLLRLGMRAVRATLDSTLYGLSDIRVVLPKEPLLRESIELDELVQEKMTAGPHELGQIEIDLCVHVRSIGFDSDTSLYVPLRNIFSPEQLAQLWEACKPAPPIRRGREWL